MGGRHVSFLRRHCARGAAGNIALPDVFAARPHIRHEPPPRQGQNRGGQFQVPMARSPGPRCPRVCPVACTRAHVSLRCSPDSVRRAAPPALAPTRAGFVTLEVNDVKLTNPHGFEHEIMVPLVPAPALQLRCVRPVPRRPFAFARASCPARNVGCGCLRRLHDWSLTLLIIRPRLSLLLGWIDR